MLSGAHNIFLARLPYFEIKEGPRHSELNATHELNRRVYI